ncbi:MAG: SCO family protein [Ponticaulis sp.]|nr:SCO family protein [Ponticaulis sp.]
MIRSIFLTLPLFLAACGDAGTSGGIASSGQQETCFSRGEYGWGGPISLINQDGERVTEEDFKGRPTVMFFGFTECPDACPIIMQKIIYALEDLPEGMERPRTMIISFDPERDTPERLQNYISNEFFPEDMVGLTGTDDEIQAAADEFQAKYFRRDQEESAIGYTFDHSTAIYFLDENWEVKTFFLATENPKDMAVCMQNFLGSTGS